MHHYHLSTVSADDDHLELKQ